MSGGSTVREDGSAVSRVDVLLHKVESLLNLIGGLVILGVMLLSVANIVGRTVFNMPVPGYIDWMMQLVPVMAFMGLAYVQRLGGHIRMDLVVGALKGRVLWSQVPKTSASDTRNMISTPANSAAHSTRPL
ncbi:MAG: TRAP transporter small permease, partial [Pseudomonadota bacterium]